MKNKIKALFLVFLFILLNSSTLVYANIENYIGEFKQVNNFFDGDYLSNKDFDINGYYINTNGEKVILDSSKVIITGFARKDNPEITYYTSDSSGTFNINVLPFNSTVNYDSYTIEDMKPAFLYDLEIMKKSMVGYVYEILNKIKFTNNNGKILTINPNEVLIDASNFSTSIGTYSIKYKCGFFNNNAFESNKYDTISGEFNVVINDLTTANTEIKDTTLSLTASKIYFDTVGISYDININNMPDNSVVEFISNDINIATVNSKSGLIKSVTNGTTTIKCTITDAENTVNTFLVNVKVGSIDSSLPSISQTQLNLSAGDIFDLGATNKIDKSFYKYKTTNSDIVSVKALTGKGMAMSDGTAIIYLTITTPDKLVIVRKCKVTVN